jgi:hypothetical protein
MVGRQLDVTYTPLTVTTPTGTTSTAPQSTPIDLGDVQLVQVELRIPPGHSGLTGVSVQYAGQSLVPWATEGGWIIGDDDLLSFDVGFEVGQGLTVVTYNAGTFTHSHYLRFLWQPLGADELTGVASTDLLPIMSLTGTVAAPTDTVDLSLPSSP